MPPRPQTQEVPIPKRMRTLERDARGYPVPFIVLRDRQGVPRFTINDVTKVAACLTKKLCSICGKRLDIDMWLVGGSRAFLHDDGVFLDPPLHYECAVYALQVCPFLAAPNYSKGIGARKVDLPYGIRTSSVEHSGPTQPERFGLGCTRAYRKLPHEAAGAGVVLKIERWGYIEWWRNGTSCAAPDARRVDEIRTERRTQP